MTEKYVIVTAISSYRMKYCIPVSELQELNPEHPVQPKEWAMDCVTMNEVKEFSQHWLGEQIVEAREMTEEEMLSLFDEENEYLNSWSREKKIEHVKNWKTPY
jgi:hypothetical protein